MKPIAIGVAIMLGCVSVAQAENKGWQSTVNSEAQFVKIMGAKAHKISDGTYEVTTDTGGQRFYFGPGGMRSQLEEFKAIAISTESKSPLIRDSLMKLNNQIQRMTEDLNGAKQSSQLNEWVFECFQSINLITEANNVAGSLSTSTWMATSQFAPTTPMAIFGYSALIDGFGNEISASVDTDYQSNASSGLGPLTTSASGTGDGTLGGACRATSAATYIGYSNYDYDICAYRGTSSWSDYHCG